jgi:hypothetical protein
LRNGTEEKAVDNNKIGELNADSRKSGRNSEIAKGDGVNKFHKFVPFRSTKYHYPPGLVGYGNGTDSKKL